jgi:RimJ/RimL family protein N-acetyltransferase
LLIGEKDTWGKGYATEIFKMIVRHAFLTLNLNKVTAGVYADNLGSSKALARAGFVEEGVRRQHCFMNGAYTDLIIFGVLREEFLRQELVEEALSEGLEKSSSY